MKISYNWLKEFVAIDWTATKTGELLTDLGLEVEGIEQFETVKGGLKGIIVGEVLTCVQHPNADRLKVTTVDLGDGNPLQVVCGAPNVAAGQKVPVATIGTLLYDEKGESFKIKKGKIRGEESFGMICAEDELGLGTSHDGILVLDNDTKAGLPLSTVLKIATDEVFEIGLTPNRADAMSHFGVARDLRVGLLQKGLTIDLLKPSISSFNVDNTTFAIQINVEDKEKAPRYAGITLRDVTVGESPDWIKNRLKAIGIAPINNIVDITNFVMHEMGQPLHAFDADKIKGNEIRVKTLASGTKFVTLDEKERELHQDDLMICDGEDTPLCIAGVFGGLHSGVSKNTKNIFLESAYFDPITVRKTAKRHQLNTDASFRFERGIDPNLTIYALKRAAILIKELAGGLITTTISDNYSKKIENQLLVLPYNYLFTMIGKKIPRDNIKEILASLEIKINNETESALGLEIPAYRNDVTRPADIVEEILRVYGYNNIDNPKKLNTSLLYTDKYNNERVQNSIANQLVAQGFYEMMNNSLTTPKYIEFSEDLNAERNVTMLNPLSNDLSVMRQSMLFSGLEVISYNINRSQRDLKLFEFGKTYHKFANNRVQEDYSELRHLSMFMTGAMLAENWKSPSDKADFFYFKSWVKMVLAKLGVQSIKESSAKEDFFSEGLTFTFAKKTKLVSFGVIKHKVLKEFGIKQDVFYADFDWDNILEVVKYAKIKVSAMPKYPAVRRDLALLLDDAVSFKELQQIANQTEKKLLKEVNLFDVYTGDKLPEGKKSYALSFTLQDEQKTLNDKTIDKVMQKLITNFEKQVNASLR